ncbi:MAG: tyrosine-type recombinase/integrase [Eubacteriaceae bacterium]|nr:tyrosine-type recombinase/integrase [Eubacteriaceae bacterium]
MISLLPDFAEDFFRGISEVKQIRTRISYAHDMRVFFEYLLVNHTAFDSYESIHDFSVNDLEAVTAIDIEKYTEYLSAYSTDKNGVKKVYTNTAPGKNRKMSTLRSFYKYYYRKEVIRSNPTLLVDLPKLRDRAIVRLDPNESADLLDAVEEGTNLSERQKLFHDKNKQRDLALVTLLLGTGIRVSECAGLDISDVNFANNSFLVTRKGGDQEILYMPEEVAEALTKYVNEERNEMLKNTQIDPGALFLSLRRSRLTVSSIEKMLKKYALNAVPLKNISPHKLRSTFGTNLYRETNDIYLVADVLGHKDINTTRRHYVTMDEDRKKQAAKVTKLRD